MSLSDNTHKLAIVIATKDRPVQLAKLLSSIKSQTSLPEQVVVVDGSDNPVQGIAEDFPGLAVKYVRVYPPALTKQKNAGVAAVNDDVSLVGFLDDDIVLETGSLEAMLSFWKHASPRVGGASFNLTGYTYSRSWLKSLPKRLFFIDDQEFGKVLRSGFNTPIWDTQETRPARWLGGGFTVWRKEVFNRWKFDEWFPGSGLWEDVQFSYKVGAEYEFAVVAEARASHAEEPATPKGELALGKRQIVNWMYFVRSNPDLSRAMCVWACVGRTATNVAKGLARRDGHLMLRGLGNSLGLAIVLFQAMTPTVGRSNR